jgi:hypothetical protein
MILQFLHPHFKVEHHTDLQRPDEFTGSKVIFKDRNWIRMIKVVDQDYLDKYQSLYGYLPKFGLVWLGYMPRPQRKEDYTSDDEICSLVDGAGNPIEHPLNQKPKAVEQRSKGGKRKKLRK